MNRPPPEVEGPLGDLDLTEFSASRSGSANDSRRNDLDILRIACIVLLVFFHAAMPFNADWDWFVTNDERSRLLLEVSFFISRWRMALLFTISGVGTAFALKRRTGRQYVAERSQRLLVPIIFGSLVLVPPQVAAERMQDGVHYASLLDFIKSYGTLLAYPDGNWSWHHLWFVAYLFLYSVMALPFFLWLRTESGKRFHEEVDRHLATPKIYALCLPMALAYATLIEKFHGPQDIFRDWAMFLLYFCTFVYGYVLGTQTRVWQGIQDLRRTSLGLAVTMLLFVNILRWNRIEPPPGPFPQTIAYLALTGAMPWFWVLAILGYARKYLRVAPPWLEYANRAAYPVYVLHQTVVVGLAYYIVQLKEPIFAKYLFLAPTSLALTVLIYHLYVRPFRPMRFLFGMKG